MSFLAKFHFSGNGVSQELVDENFNRPSLLTGGKEAKRLVVAQVPVGTQPLIPRFIKGKKIYTNRQTFLPLNIAPQYQHGALTGTHGLNRRDRGTLQRMFREHPFQCDGVLVDDHRYDERAKNHKPGE